MLFNNMKYNNTSIPHRLVFIPIPKIKYGATLSKVYSVIKTF